MARRLIANLDRPLLFTTLAIAALGLYNLASAGRPLGSSLHLSQGVHVLAGLGIMALVAAVHYRNLEAIAFPILVVCVLLLVATDAFGKIVNGSRRWLVLGPINMQTSDLAKIAVILAIARTFQFDRVGEGLTLREIFRPLNVSRPLVIVLGVILALVFGDALRPAAVEREVREGRFRPVARLSPAGGRLLVGRASHAEVRLPNARVSPEHAEIVRLEEGRYLLRDLGSEAGSFVNDQAVDGERELLHGDVLRFGVSQRTELRFSAPMQRVRSFLPWIAVIGAVWLFLALWAQYTQGSWTFRDLVAPIDAVAVPCVLILVQPDLGTTMIVLLIAFTVILYVGLRPVSLVALASGSAAFGVIAWFVLLKPYQKERVFSFLNPASDLAGAGYHQNQSLIAIGSGGLTGKGHGQGTQTQLSFLPEQQTDFIFSVWAEEQGLVGSVLVVLLFVALILLSLRVAARARERFGALLAVGVSAMFFWHAVINMLMVLRLAPVVGVPLPLWSNGGSFVMASMIGVGLLLNVSMRRHMF